MRDAIRRTRMSETPKRLSLIWPSLATPVVLLFGVVTTGLWMPAVMMFDAPGSIENKALIAFALYSSAGPVASILGLIVGWVRVAMGKRASGLKWMIIIPIIWLVGLLGWLAIVSAFCESRFSCGA
ncbi:hypothetical protein [Maricaulis parjimensis]|uniref:hypothetical protein n=1 Tax=Maricaulis parjimensis TaxID=144023 RepID=UPI0019394F9E|nr:hypothetical protein [Maricaulis parjimensis]